MSEFIDTSSKMSAVGSEHSDQTLDENSNASAFNICSSNSPLKKRGRLPELGHTNSILSQGSSWEGSQCSQQDMISRMNLMTYHSSQEAPANIAGSGEYSNESAFIPFRSHSAVYNRKQVTEEQERKITIPPPIQNIFLPVFEPETLPTALHRCLSTERYLEGQPARSVDIWLGPFQERPYYMTHFHQEAILGAGNFSEVYKARKRLDGCLYAIKKLKERISSDASGNSALKEVCALAALQGCEHIVRYYSCWIEDSHLWIQTELCLPITLDVYVLGMPRRKMANYFCSSQDGFGNSSDAAFVTMTEDVDSTAWPEGEPIPENVAWTFLKTVAEALEYMHMRGTLTICVKKRKKNISVS